MPHYRAAIVGAGRMAGTIDDEVRGFPGTVLPYSHAAGYAEVPEVDVVAIADLEPAKATALSERYGIPKVYGDYREMIEKEQPDIVSVTTPGTAHAEIAIFAANSGVKGIYCEKAFCCSLREADAIVEAVESSGVKYNMGTLRRWSAGANAAKSFIDSGELGTVNAVVSYSCGSLLHSASHFLDMILYFAGDAPIEWAQGTITNADFDPTANRSDEDMGGVGVFRFANGVTGHIMNSSLWAQHEVICSEGALRTRNDCGEWDVWKAETVMRRKVYTPYPFPDYQRESSTVRLIRDLVQAIETDGETQQGVRTAAMTAEMAFAVVDSHRQGGKRVSIPVENRDFWMFTH